MDVSLEIKRGSKKTREIRLRAEETLIGRQSGCDMRIPSAAVSRKHCRLWFRDGYLSVEDLGSSNGTFVNGERVEDTLPLRPGDLLEVGPVTFLVKYELSRAVADRLEREGKVPMRLEPPDIVDVAPVEDHEFVDVTPVDDQKQTAHFDLKKPTAPAKKPTPEKAPPKKEPPPIKLPEESAAELSPADVNDMFDGPLTIPVEEDLRNLLAGLDDSQKD